MYDYIKGILANKTNSTKGTFVTVEAGGIGYMLEVTTRDFNKSNFRLLQTNLQ